MASPSRRSARKKARVSYDESLVEVKQEQEVSKRRGPPKKRPVADFSSGSEDEEESQKPPPSKKSKNTRGSVQDRTCPHCKKVCSSKSGFKYHIEHFVCRPALNPNGNPKFRGKVKKRAASQDLEDDEDEYTEESTNAAKPKASSKKGGKKKFKKIRGPLEARTCPHCNKVFTSALGKEYHVQNKVCTDKKPLQADTKTPYPTLVPGQTFITAFGVVQVISDIRAIPVATLPEDAELKAKAYKASNQKARTQQQKGNLAAAVKTRAQRTRLSQVYERGDVSQRSIWKAMYRADPRVIAKQASNRPAQSRGPNARSDPLTPEGSYPDRIVECVLIPDERSKYPHDDSYDEDESMEVVPDATKSPYGMKLFLRRRILTEPYVASSTIYTCQDCGQHFGSKVGYNYHTKGRVCISKRKKMTDARRKFLETVEARAAKEVDRRTRPERRKSRKNVPVYPQVWLSLGFQFVAEKPLTKPHHAEENEEEPEPLDDVLSRLRNQLRRDHDRSLGTMYPEVFDALQFKRPTPRRQVEEQQRELKRQKASAKIRLEMQKAEQEKERREQEKERRRNKPPPPIVDIQVLADEADTGRYPSIKRYNGEHDDVCTICKNQVDGTLYCCDFCPHVVHLDCIREKHTIKEPEPHEDFMCHLCIQYIQARRNRAEKRRIQKQKTALQKTGGANVLVGSGGESEYHDVAALGHDLRDLTELIQDAKVRLGQAIGVSKMNDVRRSMLV
jgi:hypothetical protein